MTGDKTPLTASSNKNSLEQQEGRSLSTGVKGPPERSSLNLFFFFFFFSLLSVEKAMKHRCVTAAAGPQQRRVLMLHNLPNVRKLFLQLCNILD